MRSQQSLWYIDLRILIRCLINTLDTMAARRIDQHEWLLSRAVKWEAVEKHSQHLLLTTVLTAGHKLKHKCFCDQMLRSDHYVQSSWTSPSMASCLYFCPNVFLLPCAVPYASIFCIIVHGIVFLTVFLNLPPAWHLIQCNHGLQAYNTHRKRIRAQTQSTPAFWH